MEKIRLFCEGYNKQGVLNSRFELPTAYLAKFVDVEKDYPVDYVIQQDGTKKHGNFMLKGKDLTQKQIVELFVFQVL